MRRHKREAISPMAPAPLDRAEPIPRLMLMALLAIVVPYALFLISTDAALMSLAEEDGVIEWLGALFFLAGAVAWFVYFRKGGGLIALLLAVVFLLGFGEEISWGQRIFGWETPAVIDEYNVQGETSLHNLTIFQGNIDGEAKTGLSSFLTIDRLFTLFWLSFCVLIPVLYLLVRRSRRIVDKVRLPVIPLGLGAFFLFNYVISKLIESASSSELLHSVQETKEAIFAVLFFLVSLYFVVRARRPLATEVVAQREGMQGS